jgi:hypothetical protein
MCVHGRQRRKCKEGCGGLALCVHLKDKYSCMACKAPAPGAGAPESGAGGSAAAAPRKRKREEEEEE